ncbi:hypothetical protein [Acutalibacter sp. 1XD8-36]|uniref:hypothetical protein n=1 Tax=Acutalibacter sp. 1XD8-36 TaxID=2320852 RepID=UPI00261422A1|nr:hypothetical protein [Acutalibacter sp. 1XD8-36]
MTTKRPLAMVNPIGLPFITATWSGNLHRRDITTSKLAQAAKMKLETLKHQGHRLLPLYLFNTSSSELRLSEITDKYSYSLYHIIKGYSDKFHVKRLEPIKILK